MNYRKFRNAVMLLMLSPVMVWANPRTESLLEKGWRFTREDNTLFSTTDYADGNWQQVRVPHDWAIYGPFSIDNDKQNVAITQDGQKEAMEHAGRTGGLPFIGPGWYRIAFDVPEFKEGKKCTIIFDGAMSHANVYINGEKATSRPYGYTSFNVDATPFIKEGEKVVLAVRLENLIESSRWYPGAGIYRNVHVIVTEDAHVPVYGTQLTTPVIEPDYAKVNLKTKLEMPANKTIENYTITTEIKDATGNVVASNNKKGCKYDGGVFEQNFVVEEPILWTLDNPVLYTAESKIYEGENLKDTYSTTFGFRTIKIIPNKGFYLNGERTQFKGVCNHHDLGPLGGIANEAGIRRQVRILKDMGCNAIRTSHNMPAPELVKACDEMGRMLMLESFDEWVTP